MTHTPIEIARLAAERLERDGIENARLEAELLLADVLGVKRLDLYLQYDRPLTEDEVARYRSLLVRRLRHEPLQYIVGHAQFRSLDLVVDRRVLIPRPETEVLVGCVLERCPPGAAASGRIALDIGAGSGAIGLSLAAEGDFGRVVLTDASVPALDVARENARRHGLESRVEFRAGRLFAPLGDDERFDVIVSNPPYVAEEDRPGLQPEVADWEPAGALFAAEGGLAVLRALAADAWRWLVPGGLLGLELAPGQADDVRSVFEGTGAYDAPLVVKDLAGRERVILATRHIAQSEGKSDHG